jgi:hypothetical protein
MVLFSCSMLLILCYEWITTGAGEFINRKVDGDLKMVGVHGLWALVLSSHLHFSPLKLSRESFTKLFKKEKSIIHS